MDALGVGPVPDDVCDCRQVAAFPLVQKANGDDDGDDEDEETEAAGKESASAKPSVTYLELERLRRELASESAAKKAINDMLMDAIKDKAELHAQLGDERAKLQFQTDDKFAWKRDFDDIKLKYDSRDKDYYKLKDQLRDVKHDHNELRAAHSQLHLDASTEKKRLEDKLAEEHKNHMDIKAQYEALKASAAAQEKAQAQAATLHQEHAKAMQALKDEHAKDRQMANVAQMASMVTSTTLASVLVYLY